MQSRGFLELGPSELAALCRAFDDAWEVVKPRYSMELSEIARLCLAEDVLDAYRNGLLDADLIAAHALEHLGHGTSEQKDLSHSVVKARASID